MDPRYKQIMNDQGADHRKQRMDEEMKRMLVQTLLSRITGGGGAAGMMPQGMGGGGGPPMTDPREAMAFQPDGGTNTMMDMLRAYLSGQGGR